jgi:O-antigen ligase/polysaccharide polymerase Wzy-like membrane protein
VETAHPFAARRRIEASWVALVVAAGLVVSFAALGVFLGRHPLPMPLVLGFGVGLLGTLALVLARYDAAVALGIFLLAAVRIEPAPSDLVFGVLVAVALATWRFDLQSVPLSITLLISAFLALNLMASIEVIDPARAVSFFGITLYLGVFGLWLAGYVHSVRRARLVLLAYLAAAVLSAAVACLALFAPIPAGELFVRGPRAQALFKDPNVFGPFLVPAALVLMEETVAPRLLRLRLLTKLAFLSVLTAGILFSFSRAAWLNLAVGAVALLGVLALRRGGVRQALSLIAVVLTAGAALFAVVATTSSLTFLQERAAIQVYDTQRFGAQLSGFELATEYPLGVGPGQFERVSEISAHSTYVRALAEEGVLGILVVLALMLLTLGFAARNAALGTDSYGIGSAALFGSWCGVLANSVFVDTLHWRHLWLIAALIWAATALRTRYPGR